MNQQPILQSDWSRVWSIDGDVVSGASTAKLSYTFGLTAHKYTVEYVAQLQAQARIQVRSYSSVDVTTRSSH